MKKIKTIIAVLTAALVMGAFVGCTASTSSPDSGSGDSGGSGGSGGSGTTSGIWSKFEGADIQIWSNTFTAEEDSTDGLVITVGSVGWWGGCFCNAGAVAPTASDVVTFDMSNVAKITFDAKASASGSMWVSCSDSAANTKGKTTMNLTTDFVSQTFNCTGNVSSTDYGVLDFGGENASGTIVYIKNIAFYDSTGTEIVPTRNE